MERPGLKQLLQDIRDRRIDVVVVYKVDRLTRSLADFAKMMEVFDASEVSFVSVTQQFNTTSSMGRLTLNILLSFAQFERELTGERIGALIGSLANGFPRKRSILHRNVRRYIGVLIFRVNRDFLRRPTAANHSR